MLATCGAAGTGWASAGSTDPVRLTRVCVFCGSSLGADPAYAGTARGLGAELAARRIGLVYGGAGVGLMREVADACRAAGGEVTGVIPESPPCTSGRR